MFNKSRRERVIKVNVQQETERENHTSKCSARARERIIQVNVQQEQEIVIESKVFNKTQRERERERERERVVLKYK